MPPYVYLNGHLVEKSDASIAIYDHGFLYGDGIFEGLRVYSGSVFMLDAHLKRLYRSAQALGIEINITRDAMKAAVLETVATNQVSSAYIRLTVSRGVGLGLDPKHIDVSSTVVISTEQIRLYPASAYENGLDVITASTRVPPKQCIDPQIKSLGRYINNILAKMEANRVGAGEALMLNLAGNVAEATGDNLFIVRDGALLTPPTTEGALPGITRDVVMQEAKKAGIECHEECLSLYDVYNADEAFLTGTAAEVIPMVQLDGRKISGGKPGPITRRLLQLFHEATHRS